MNSEHRQKGTELIMSGELSLSRSLVIKEDCEKACTGGGMVLSFGEVQNVDIAFLQVLVSACRTALIAGREVGVDVDSVPAKVSTLVRRAGLHRGRPGSGEFWSLLAGAEGGH